MADSGHDISRFFTNQGTMKQPLTSISVEITQEMLQELDQLAAALRISRQAAINSCLRKALDQRLLVERPARGLLPSGQAADHAASRRGHHRMVQGSRRGRPRRPDRHQPRSAPAR